MNGTGTETDLRKIEEILREFADQLRRQEWDQGYLVDEVFQIETSAHHFEPTGEIEIRLRLRKFRK